jgi:aminoglycoside phosphotransferase (APT) family kinase protein
VSTGETIRGIDVDNVTAWLAATIDGAEPPFAFSLITGGHSNLTYLVVDATGRRLVLRRPPLGHVLATAHDMAREHRIITAVGHSDVPVAPALGLCTDTAVNGAPFYVMGFVDGVVLDDPDKAESVPMPTRHLLGIDLVDVLADLHVVDVDAVGLGDLAKRDGYVERQIKRWSTQWASSKTRELPAIEAVVERLGRSVPVQQGVSIAHGDFRFGNCLSDVASGRIAAVLDWELCTLGDPLADLGYLGVYWSDAERGPGRQNDPTLAGGFPSYRELVERYEARTGRDASGIDYYVAFSCFRLAVITEGVYARYLHGVMGDATAEQLALFKNGTEQLAGRALALLTPSGA